MPNTYPKLCVRDPLRDPAWRYRRAERFAETPASPAALPCRTEDEPTRYLLQVMRHLPRLTAYLSSCAAAPEQEREWHCLKPWKAEIVTALQIYFDEATNLPGMLQAAILARLNDAAIAARIAATPEVVKWYHWLFFDVRDRLDARDWIVRIIRAPFAARGAVAPDCQDSSHDWAVALMAFAYFGGPHALDSVAHGFRDGAPLRDASDAEQWFGQTLAHLVQVNAAVAAESLRSNRKDVMKLLSLATRRERAQGGRAKRTAGAVGQAPEYIATNVQAMLNLFPSAASVEITAPASGADSREVRR